MDNEIEEIVTKVVTPLLKRTNASDYVLSILIARLIKQGVLDSAAFKEDLIQTKNALIENNTEEEIKADKDILAGVIDTFIKDIEAMESNKE